MFRRSVFCLAAPFHSTLTIRAKATSKSSASESQRELHTLPHAVLEQILCSVGANQKAFVLGTDASGKTVRKTFFATINMCYEARIAQEEKVEAEAFILSRREHYNKRLAAETEEFRAERREIHDEIHRAEIEQYKNDFFLEMKDFSTLRQREFAERLKADINHYDAALHSYQARKGKSSDYDDLVKNLQNDAESVKANLETEDDIYKYGLDSLNGGTDITDEDIAEYVERRYRFYETALESDTKSFSKRRKVFYEELIQARSIRHEAKITADTAAYRAKRDAFYQEQLKKDAVYFTKAFRNHYERCFLQCYAHEAWVSYRAGTKGSSISAPGPIPPEDEAKMTATELNKTFPLASVLDIYEKQSVAEPTRDIFIKAARRVAGAKTNTSTNTTDSVAANQLIK